MTTQTITQIGNGPSAEQVSAQVAHDTAMAAKGGDVSVVSVDHTADGTKVVSTNDVPVNKPDHIPAKFWDAANGKLNEAALLQSYKDLEAKQSKPTEAPKETPTETPKPDDKPQQQEAPKGETPTQQNAIDNAAKEYAEKGELTQATVDALVESGIAQVQIDNYMAGVKAQEALLAQEVFSVTGGEPQYRQMIDWASANLSDADAAAFDQALSKPATAKGAVEGLWARYQSQGNFEPSNTVRGKNSQAAGEMFASSQQMQAAMNDARYRSGDAAFHAEVQMKISNALAAGVDLFR